MKKIDKKCSLVLPVLLFAFIWGPGLANGQDKPETIVLGTRMKITSKFLNEEREVVVSLPVDYEKSQDKFPILILLDGDKPGYVVSITAFLARWGHIPPLIVAAVPTPSPRHHYRDFTPIKVNYLPASGGAEDFLKFLKQELIPLLEVKYRCQTYRILSGNGMSGLFTLYTLLTSPETFASYLTTSPSITFADNSILLLAEKSFPTLKIQRKFVFMAAGKEKVTIPAIQAFEKIIKKNPANGLQYQCLFADDEDQGTIAYRGLYHGLKALYADWRFPMELVDRGLPAIERYCQILSEKYGSVITLNEDFLVKRSIQLFQEQGFEDSLRILQLAVAAYPESFQIYYWLGFVNEKIKNLEKAKEDYEMAYKKGSAAQSPMADFYRQEAERIAKKIE